MTMMMMVVVAVVFLVAVVVDDGGDCGGGGNGVHDLQMLMATPLRRAEGQEQHTWIGIHWLLWR